MNSEAQHPKEFHGKASGIIRADGADLVVQALDFVRGVRPATGETPGAPTVPRQKAAIRKWAENLGLLLDPDVIIPRLTRGGQEHDVFQEGERILKVTRDGMFGLSPGIDLALVSSDQDARRFHLWEATPLEYLMRLELHNLLVPGLNHLEGVLCQPDGDLAIMTSQPRFDIVPVTEEEIDDWFAKQGFRRVTHSGYYRDHDNLGVFDAHDKNVVRALDTLVPFDVIPCHPSGGFLKFIEETLASGHTLRTARRASTMPRVVP